MRQKFRKFSQRIVGVNFTHLKLRLSTGVPAGYLDPYPWVFRHQNQYPDLQRFFPMDHLDPQVKNLQVTGLNRSPANNRYLQVPKGIPTGIKIKTQSNSKNLNKT
jgi:hypothetical protein